MRVYQLDCTRHAGILLCTREQFEKSEGVLSRGVQVGVPIARQHTLITHTVYMVLGKLSPGVYEDGRCIRAGSWAQFYGPKKPCARWVQDDGEWKPECKSPPPVGKLRPRSRSRLPRFLMCSSIRFRTLLRVARRILPGTARVRNITACFTPNLRARSQKSCGQKLVKNLLLVVTSRRISTFCGRWLICVKSTHVPSN